MNPKKLHAIESRAKKAARGTWSHAVHPANADSHLIRTVFRDVAKRRCTQFVAECYALAGDLEYSAHNAEFISHARSDVLALCAEVRRLQAQANLQAKPRCTSAQRVLSDTSLWKFRC